LTSQETRHNHSLLSEEQLETMELPKKIICVTILSIFILINSTTSQQSTNLTRVVIPAMARKAGGKLRPEFIQQNNKPLSIPVQTTSTTLSPSYEDSEISEEQPETDEEEEEIKPRCTKDYMLMYLYYKKRYDCVPKHCPNGRESWTYECIEYEYYYPRNQFSSTGYYRVIIHTNLIQLSITYN